jgi:alpha-D-xyloside xylohydrolase
MYNKDEDMQTVGTPKEPISDGQYIVFGVHNEKRGVLALRLSCSKNGVWRLQSTDTYDTCGVHTSDGLPKFSEKGAAVTLANDLGEKWEDPCCNLELSQIDSCYEIKTEHGRCATLSLDPFRLSFKGDKNVERTAITDISADERSITLYGPLAEDEYIYGTGQRFNRVNQRGKICTMMAIDKWCQTEGNSYMPIPFIISSRGYGLFMDRFELSIFDLGGQKDDQWSISIQGAPIDFRVFIEDDPKKILESYAQLTGFSPMPADWLFGIFVCRHARLRELASYENVMEVTRMMEKHGFPWDGIILEGWQAYDTKTYPELKKTVAALHAMGKKVLVYQACGRISHTNKEEIRKYFFDVLDGKKEYFVKTKDGETLLPETNSYNPMDNPDGRYSEYVDLTNPEAYEWWFGNVWKKLVCDIGIDGAKIDFCEQFPEHIELMFYNGRETRGAHHWYPTLFNALMYRFYNENRPEGGMCFSRGGSIGAQRYPFLWAGDQRREWVFLRAILRAILSSGLSGVPFMSHDLAGYMPANDPEANPEPKVFVRGTQFGCFTLNMQTHGTVTRPYEFEKDIRELYRIYSEVHQALRPYLVEQSRIACTTGLPPIRHLFLYDHTDPRTFDIEDQYMLGDALLIAPVFEDTEKRDVYLPQGEWQELFSGDIYTGRQMLKDYPSPFTRIPVFYNKNNKSACIRDVLGKIKEIIKDL